MPKKQEWRDLFVSKPGFKIITADYSQIELRILCEYSQDRTFMDVFNRGGDLHSITAANIFRVPLNKVSKNQRDMAKTINFGICYGMTPKGLADQLNISIKMAKMAIDSYFDAYPQIKPTLEWLGERARDDGFSVTINGRKRYYPPGKNGYRTRQGKNTPIQGTCGDILKKALSHLKNSFKALPAHIVNLVHDEIVIEARESCVDKAIEIIEKDMITAGKLFIRNVPVLVDIKISDVWKK